MRLLRKPFQCVCCACSTSEVNWSQTARFISNQASTFTPNQRDITWTSLHRTVLMFVEVVSVSKVVAIATVNFSQHLRYFLDSQRKIFSESLTRI